MEKNCQESEHIIVGVSSFFPWAEFGLGFDLEIAMEL